MGGYIMEGNTRRLPEVLSVLLLFISISLLLLSPQIASAETKHIQVQINGETLMTDVAPVMIDGRVMVPFKAIFTALGVTDIVWEDQTKTVKAAKGETTIELQIDRNIAIVNGQEIELDVTPQIVNGRTLVPARFVAETLDMDVQWVPKINMVIIKPKEADIAYFENRYMRVPLKYSVPMKIDEYSYTVMLEEYTIMVVNTLVPPVSNFELYVAAGVNNIASAFDLKSVEEIAYKGKKAYKISFTADNYQWEQILGQELEEDGFDLFLKDQQLHFITTICQDNIGNMHQFLALSNDSESLENSYQETVIPFIETVEYLNTNYVDETYDKIVTENFTLTTRQIWEVLHGDEIENELQVEFNALSAFVISNGGTLEDLGLEGIDFVDFVHGYFYHLEEEYELLDTWYDEYEYEDLGYYVYEFYFEHEKELIMYDGTKVTYIESVEYLMFENKRGEVSVTIFYTPLDDIEVTYDYYLEVLQGLEIRDTLSKEL